MADHINICWEHVYQHKQKQNRESNKRSPRNLSPFFLTNLVCLDGPVPVPEVLRRRAGQS